MNIARTTGFLRFRWLCNALEFVALVALATAAHAQPAKPADGYAGSAACNDCHESQYERWKTTRMANVIVDPKQHPEAVLGDFKTANPLVTFKPKDLAFVYGSKWKQRYFVKRGEGSEPVDDVPSRSVDRERDGDDPEMARGVAMASAAVTAAVHCARDDVFGSQVSSRKE
jgi:hypothetical protein